MSYTNICITGSLIFIFTQIYWNMLQTLKSNNYSMRSPMILYSFIDPFRPNLISQPYKLDEFISNLSERAAVH